MSDKVLLDRFRIGLRFCIHILINRTFRSMEIGMSDGICQFSTSRLHQRRMESTTHFEFQSPFCTGLQHLCTGSIYTFDRTRYNNLSRAIIIGRNHDTFGYRSAQFLYFRIG